MKIFVENQTILQYSDAKRIVKNYNELSKVLLSYEMLYHRAWLRQVEVVSSGIHASVLIQIRHDVSISSASTTTHSVSSSVLITSTGEVNPTFAVNFDPNIFELIRETQCLMRLGLEIPAAAADLLQREETLKKFYQNLTEILEKNSRIRSKIRQPFESLLGTKIHQLNNFIKPGLTSITWTSLTIDQFIQTVRFDSF